MAASGDKAQGNGQFSCLGFVLLLNTSPERPHSGSVGEHLCCCEKTEPPWKMKTDSNYRLVRLKKNGDGPTGR